MNSCRKCGTEFPDRTLSCPHCGASQTLDALLSVAVMKLLGIVCGVVGVALLVFADQIEYLKGTDSQVRYDCAVRNP